MRGRICFSFGVVAVRDGYRAVAVRGESSGLIFKAILDAAPVAPVRLNPDLPTEMERIINKAIEKDREIALISMRPKCARI